MGKHLHMDAGPQNNCTRAAVSGCNQAPGEASHLCVVGPRGCHFCAQDHPQGPRDREAVWPPWPEVHRQPCREVSPHSLQPCPPARFFRISTQLPSSGKCSVSSLLAEGWPQSTVSSLHVKLDTVRQLHAQGCTSVWYAQFSSACFPPGAGCTQPRTRLRPGAGLRSMQQTTRLTPRQGGPSSIRRLGAVQLPATSRACPSANGCTPSGALLHHPYETRRHLLVMSLDNSHAGSHPQ